MSRSNLVLAVIAFAACFLLLVVLTSEKSASVQAAPMEPRFADIRAHESSLTVMFAPGFEKAIVAQFSSKKDADAAAKLLREALQWADPKVRVMAPPAR